MKILELMSFDMGEFSLIAENEIEQGLLRRFLDLRQRTSLRAHTWQYDMPNKRRPNELVVISLDLRLAEDSVFEELPKPGHHGPDEKDK
jgi:hypothetical protein